MVIFGESDQELGVIAHRVIGGKGGVNEGSMVGVVKALMRQGWGEMKKPEKDDDGGPGIVLANTGELWWWPEGGRGLTARQSQAVPMKSCVHWGRFYDAAANAIPGNEGVDQHVESVFESVLGNPELVSAGIDIQVLGVGDGAVAAARYLDRNWGRWAGRVGCLAMLGAGVDAASVESEGFRVFLKEVSVFFNLLCRSCLRYCVLNAPSISVGRLSDAAIQKSRLYITCQEPLNTLISGPEGNPKTTLYTSYGCPVFSSGETFYSEMTLIRARDIVLPWLEEVYQASKGYVNPEMEVTFADARLEETPAWVDGDTDLAAPSGAVLSGGKYQGREGGLEIITREEWEARMSKEGKEREKNKVLVPANVLPLL